MAFDVGTSAKSSWSTSVTPTAPRDIVVDDLILLFGYSGANVPASNPSFDGAVFTDIHRQQASTARTLLIGWRRAEAADAGSGKSWTYSTNTAGSSSNAAQCVLISDINWSAGGAPFAATTPAILTSPTATPDSPAITTTVDDALILSGLMSHHTNTVSAFPETDNQYQDSQENNVGWSFCTNEQATAGAKPAGAWTLSEAVSSMGYTIAFSVGEAAPPADTLTDITLSATHDTVSSTCKSTVLGKPLAFGLRTDRPWASGDEAAIFADPTGAIVYTEEMTSAANNTATADTGIGAEIEHYAGWLRDDTADYWALPFDATTSPWRLTFDEMAAAWCTNTALSTMGKPITKVNINYQNWTIAVARSTEEHPDVDWHVYNPGERDYYEPMRLNPTAHESLPNDPTEDRDAALVNYDAEADIVWEMYKASVENKTSKACWENNIRGRGITSPGETRTSPRASSCSMLGGLIRHWELADITKPLLHPLAMSVDRSRLKTGPIFPASTEDYDPGYYGDSPMGTMLRLDPAVDVDAMLSDPTARWIGHALQDYGCYIVDRASNPIIHVEFEYPHTYAAQIEAAKISLDDAVFCSHLKEVDRTYIGGTPPWTV